MEVDKENLRSLPNDDLFKIMKKYGINVGPVNISTRSVYEKKLKNYLESIENGQNPAQTKYSNIEQENVQILATKGVITPVGLNELYQFSHGLNIKALR